MSDRQEGWYWILIEGRNPPWVGLYQGSAWYAAQFEQPYANSDVQVLSDRLVPPNEAEPIAS
jgi:hypothetical protein